MALSWVLTFDFVLLFEALMVNYQLSTGFYNWVHSQAHLINASRLGITATL